jgi:hypothetical protein
LGYVWINARGNLPVNRSNVAFVRQLAAVELQFAVRGEAHYNARLPHMTLEARITPVWKKQKLFVALFLLAFGGWFFYDGLFGYPRKNAHYAVWRQSKVAGQDSIWADYAKAHGLKLDYWASHAREHNWREDNLPPQALTDAQIRGQFVFGGIAAAIGLIVLAYWKQQIGRVLRIDDEAVTSPAGTRVPFTAIAGLGLKKWESKGYAVVRYEIDGRKGEFLIDDYKFDTTATRQIVDEIKAQLTARGGSVRPSTSSGRPQIDLPNSGSSPAESPAPDGPR